MELSLDRVKAEVAQLQGWVKAQYWNSAQVAGWVKNNFFPVTSHQRVSNGTKSSGHPFVLNSSGKIDTSFYDLVSINDSNFTLYDSVDNTKTLKFQLSGITTGTNRTLTAPNADGTIPLPNLAQTWTAAQTFSSGIAIGNETITVYDEGTWVPTVTSSTAPTVTYTTQLGSFWRLNNLLFYRFHIRINTISGGAGDLRVTLPGTVGSGSYVATIYTDGVDLPGTPATVIFAPTPATIIGVIIAANDNLTGTVVQIGALAAGDTLIASGFYSL